MGIAYTLFKVLDYAIYSLCSPLFGVINNLANYELFSALDIQEFSARVYMIVGVLMLFKLVISFVKFLIDPDKMNDKDNGVGGILKRTVFCVILIAIVPTLFDFALEAQKVIVQTIPTAILGDNLGSSDEDITKNMTNIGDRMAFLTLQAFVKDNNPNGSEDITDLNSFVSHVGDGCSILGGGCRYSYSVLLSTIVGGALVFFLASMAIDIAVRTIKFSILQMLAPIPIASYIDPKTSKSAFSSWVKMCTQVYADLFTRLIVIYFIVYFLQVIFKPDSITRIYEHFGPGSGSIVLILLIIGILFFGKSAPKFIGDVLGLKGASEGMAGMFKRASGLVGYAYGKSTGIMATYHNRKEDYIKKNQLDADHKFKLRDKLKFAAQSASPGHGREAIKNLKNNISNLQQNKGFKDSRQASFNQTTGTYEFEKKLSENGVTYQEYRKAVADKNRGYVDDYKIFEREQQISKEISDTSKSALDFVHNQIATKFPNVRFNSDYMITINDKLKSELDDKGRIFIGYDVNQKPQYIELKDLDGGVDGKNINATSIASLLSSLRSIKANTTGVYSGDEVAKATGLEDIISGLADSYVINEYKGGQGSIPYNPQLASLIQSAIEKFNVNSGTTKFGQDMIELGKKKGILDASGSVVDGQLGAWLAMIKKEGKDNESKAMQQKATQSARAVLNSIVDSESKK